jgi:hypothetical protein
VIFHDRLWFCHRQLMCHVGNTADILNLGYTADILNASVATYSLI